MAALSNIGCALCSTPQSLADAQYWSAMQYRCQDAKPVEISWGAQNYRIDLHHAEEILLLNKFFFQIVDTCLSCEDMARQSCAMVPRWRFFASCICSEPCAAHFRPAF